MICSNLKILKSMEANLRVSYSSRASWISKQLQKAEQIPTLELTPPKRLFLSFMDVKFRCFLGLWLPQTEVLS